MPPDSDPAGATPVRPVDVRAALVDAVGELLATATSLTPGEWDLPATDRWTVRQLFAHVVRSLAAVPGYLDAGLPREGPPLAGASGYYRTVLGYAGVHDGVAERAEVAAGAYGADPLPEARAELAAVLERVAATPGDVPVVHLVGWLPMDDYLVTRVVEVVLHTFDLQLACGREPSAPADALAVVTPFLVELADRADQRALALVLSGRASPVVCNVLA